MELENRDIEVGDLNSLEIHKEGDPVYGTDGKTVIGVRFKLGKKLLVDHFDVPLTDADREAMEGMSDQDARQYLIEKAKSNKNENVN